MWPIYICNPLGTVIINQYNSPLFLTWYTKPRLGLDQKKFCWGHPREERTQLPKVTAVAGPSSSGLPSLAIIFVNCSQSAANPRSPSQTHLQAVIDLVAPFIFEVASAFSSSGNHRCSRRISRLQPIRLPIAVSQLFPSVFSCLNSSSIPWDSASAASFHLQINPEP
jgi:hypothetical protein